MKSLLILDLMIKDHAKIVKLLNDVEKNIGKDTITIMKTFDNFEWTLEKHIFTEEKAIFTSYSPTNIREGYKMVPELVKEHNKILNTLEVMRMDLLKKKPCNFTEFKEILINHKTFEEDFLYPKLDQELTEEQKNMIITRIKEMV